MIYICLCSFPHTIDVVQTSLNMSGMCLFIIINFFPLILRVSLWPKIGSLCIIAPTKQLDYWLVPEKLSEYVKNNILFLGHRLCQQRITSCHIELAFFLLPLQFSFLWINYIHPLWWLSPSLLTRCDAEFVSEYIHLCLDSAKIPGRLW